MELALRAAQQHINEGRVQHAQRTETDGVVDDGQEGGTSPTKPQGPSSPPQESGEAPLVHLRQTRSFRRGWLEVAQQY